MRFALSGCLAVSAALFGAVPAARTCSAPKKRAGRALVRGAGKEGWVEVKDGAFEGVVFKGD